jgi:hypothetical protein
MKSMKINSIMLTLIKKKISEPSTKEYEVDIPINKPTTRAKNPRYKVHVDETGFKVERLSTKKIM